MGDGCLKMLDWLRELRNQEEPDIALADRLRHREQVLDNMQDEVAEFMTSLLSGNIPHAVADEARRQLQLADEYESTPESAFTSTELLKKSRKSVEVRLTFSKTGTHPERRRSQLCPRPCMFPPAVRWPVRFADAAG